MRFGAKAAAAYRIRRPRLWGAETAGRLAEPASAATMSDQRDSDVDLGAAHLRPLYRDRPAAGATGGRRAAAVVAWEGDRSDGLAASFAATWWLLVRSPAAAWRLVPGERGPRPAWTFALLCGAIFGVVSEVVDSSTVALARFGGGQVWPSGLFQLDVAGRSLEWLGISFLSLAGCLLAVVVAAPLFVLFYGLALLVWSAALHATLKLSGGLSGSTTGWRGTVRAVCYSQVAMAAAIVPWLGDPIAALWSFSLQVGGLARMHGCGRKRAAVAVWLPAALLIAAFVLLLWLGRDRALGPQS